MSDTTTVTIRLSIETKAQLAKLAGYTRRKQSFLGAEAIAAYVVRELAIVEAIERGRADLHAGRVVSNEEAFRQLDQVIEAATTQQRDGPSFGRLPPSRNYWPSDATSRPTIQRPRRRSPPGCE